MACLLYGAITNEEFKEWIYLVIEHVDEMPGYLFDILDCKETDGFKLSVYKMIGFTPSYELTDDESTSLTGIAVKRGLTDLKWEDDPINSLEEAKRVMSDNPHVEKRFRETFPFIDL